MGGWRRGARRYRLHDLGKDRRPSEGATLIALIGQFLAPHPLRLAGFAAILGAVVAVLFGARHAGRNPERVEQMRKTIEVQRDQLEAAAQRPRDREVLLTGCATARSDAVACLPVPTYSREFLARASGEVGKLPAGSAMKQMLGDYGVVRAQARACRG